MICKVSHWSGGHLISHIREHSHHLTPALEAHLLGSLYSHGTEEASVPNYSGESGKWAGLLPTKESCKRNKPMPGMRTKSDDDRCMAEANLLLLPSLSSAMGWMGCSGCTESPGQVSVCSGGIRALHDSGLRGQGVLLNTTLTTVGLSSHMRPETKFSCQHPGHSYLYRNRITSQNPPYLP